MDPGLSINQSLSLGGKAEAPSVGNIVVVVVLNSEGGSEQAYFVLKMNSFICKRCA